MTGQRAINLGRAVLLTSVALGALCVLGYWFFPGSRSAPMPVQPTAPTPQLAPVALVAPNLPQAPSADQSAIWVSDARGEDPAARATAIAGLSTVATALALPVLREVLRAGDPATDRPLALQSLRALALETGDADGDIRALLREAVYHSDDDAIAQAAQLTLDDIEGVVPGGS